MKIYCLFGYIFTKLSSLVVKCKDEYNKHIFGGNVRVSNEVKYNNRKHIYIGKGTYINGGRLITGNKSNIYIGENCLISYDVHIRTISHNYKDRKLINLQGHWEQDIVIEDDVWIGYGAQIMPGVRIGKGAVIGAGSICTKDIPEYGVAVGIPAVVIKYREEV